MNEVISFQKYAVTLHSLNRAREAADHPSTQHIYTLLAAATLTHLYRETPRAQERPLEHPLGREHQLLFKTYLLGTAMPSGVT